MTKKAEAKIAYDHPESTEDHDSWKGSEVNSADQRKDQVEKVEIEIIFPEGPIAHNKIWNCSEAISVIIQKIEHDKPLAIDKRLQTDVNENKSFPTE